MRPFLTLVARDVRRAWAGGSITYTLAFFLLVAILFPFAVGPDAALLARVGGGVIWSAALLAALMPVERLVGPDAESGVLDQLAMRDLSMANVATAKIVAHWLAFGPPLMVAAVIAAGLLGLPGDTLARVEIGLLIFGAGSLDGGAGAVKLLAAVSLVLLAGAPFVAGAAMRAGMD